ncbi:MAG: hypothetical protein B7Y02_15035 [Rhodobacterales bacterium 17-64-5]|nr:MAG: hypothetical protein B7Y02_15035 [Rhodobacterales bacterium 17-64-5]
MKHLTLPDGTRLAYADQGAGTALLCLPGLTRTMADFTYAKPHLAGRIIRMDYRGRGGSSWTGAASYTVGQEAQDALALMDHLGIGRFAVLGTSRGGLIGMVLAHLARLDPDLLKELVISPKGLRLVWLAEEADRTRYLAFRDSEMGKAPLPPARLEPLLNALLALRDDLKALP